MALYKFKPATSGEHLFSYITTNLIGRKNINQIYELEALQIGGRQYQLSSYYAGVLAANILTRCLKKANRIVSLFEDEREHQKQMVQYFQRSLEIPRTPSGADLDRLAALTLEAEKKSRKGIISSVRSQFNTTKTSYCYICGFPVFEKPLETQIKMQLEHIWPQSFGGDSIAENLLPACPTCNNAKSDMLLWQNAHIHSFTLKPEPSPQELENIEKKLRIAQHRRNIFEYASTHRTTLKDAALIIGSVDLSEISSIDRDDAVDFFNFGFQKRK
jgi:5-methylcytosine-specific restriction endonuclease McrA